MLLLFHFVCFARGLADLCLKFPAKKDEHLYAKLSEALGVETKILGFQVYHLCSDLENDSDFHR